MKKTVAQEATTEAPVREVAVKRRRPTAAEKAAKLAAMGPAARLQTLSQGFESASDGNEIRVVTAASPLPVTVVKFLQNTAVISTGIRARFNIAQTNVFDDILDEMRSAGLHLAKVESLNEFFDSDKRFEALLEAKTADERVRQCAAVGLTVTPEESESIDTFLRFKEKFAEHFKSLRPAYPFSKKPTGAVPLKVSSDGRRVGWGSYEITQKQAKMLWNRAFKHWSGEAKDSGAGMLRYDYTDRKIQVTEETLGIGCQRISRWAVEQLAIKMGWISA